MKIQKVFLVFFLLTFSFSLFTSGAVFCSPANWVEVESFSNSNHFYMGDTIGPFTIEHVEWRIRYEYEINDDFTLFYFDVWKSGTPVTDERVGSYHNYGDISVLEGIYNMTDSRGGEFYLTTGFNGRSYSMIIEQNTDSPQAQVDASTSNVIPASESTPEPSVPEFTVSYMDYSYDVAPVYGIDEFTGKEVIVTKGYHVNERSVMFTIKNQAFTAYTDSNGNEIKLYYNFKFKGSYGHVWKYYPFSEGGSGTIRYGNLFISFTDESPKIPASNSEYTNKTFTLSFLFGADAPPDDSQVDFQVQALTGYIYYKGDGYYGFDGQTSDWSNTQTVTIGETTQAIPEFQPWTIIPLLIGGTAVAAIQKKKLTKQPQKHNKTNRHRTLKQVTVVLLLFFLGTGLLLVIPTNICIVQASTEPNEIPKPDVPEFTVKFVDDSFRVPTTYSIDPFTGENITHSGYLVDKRTIEVTIKNQPFTSTNIDGNSTKLVYYVSWKGHFGDYWHDEKIEPSNFDYTVKTYTLGSFGNVPADGQIDFRVSAVVGYSYGVYGDHSRMMPIAINFEAVAISDSSSIQTFSFAENAVIPEFPSLTILPLLLVATVVATIQKKKLNKTST